METSDPAQRPDGSELPALIDLLADPDREFGDRIAARVMAHGQAAVEPLRRAGASDDPRRRTRARRLLERLEWSAGLERLSVVARRRSLSLETGLIALGRLAGAEKELDRAVEHLDDWAAAVLGRVGDVRAKGGAGGFDGPLSLVEVLAGEVGLTGAKDEYHHPENVHLHRAIERRRGLPLTLTAIYLSVARRAGLRAAPVALPGHVLLRLYSGQRSMLIDPFEDGAVRTRKDCLSYLMERGLAPRPDWFADADDATLFQRQIVNLANSHGLRGRRTESEELLAVAGIVARTRGLSPAADPESA